MIETDEEKEQEAGEAELESVDHMDEYIETLRAKVIEFLQDAFHTEGIVYNAEIIDQLVTADNKDQLLANLCWRSFCESCQRTRVDAPGSVEILSLFGRAVIKRYK
jgi:hypothetical protein